MKKEFDLSISPEALRGFRKELRSLLEYAGWQEKQSNEIVLAADEALTNVVRHAYNGGSGPIKVFFEDHPDKTKITIEDLGKKFDPTQAPTPELPREEPGGLGIHFIRTIMDELIYDNSFTSGNRFHMIKRKPKS